MRELRKCMPHLALAALGLSSVACGPKVSQWIYVRDCAPPHAPVANARVYVQEIFMEGQRERPYSVGHVARGGNTNPQGMTWDSFSQTRRSVAHAVVHHRNGKPVISEAERQPLTRVPPDPRQPVQICVHRLPAPTP